MYMRIRILHAYILYEKSFANYVRMYVQVYAMIIQDVFVNYTEVVIHFLLFT